MDVETALNLAIADEGDAVLRTLADEVLRLRKCADPRALLPVIAGSMPYSVSDPDGAIARNIATGVALHLDRHS